MQWSLVRLTDTLQDLSKLLTGSSIFWSFFEVFIKLYTIKICDDALGLFGFVSFFWRAYLRGGGLSMETFYRHVSWAYLVVGFFRGGAICGGTYLRGEHGVGGALSLIFKVRNASNISCKLYETG